MEDRVNTPNEILDLVDDKDEVVGEVTKAEANRDSSKLHREIGVIVFDDQNRVLIQQRSVKKTVFPSWWTVSCASHVPKGDSYEETAHRELAQELGFDVPLTFIRKLKIKEANETHFICWYIGQYLIREIHFNREEIAQIKFINRKEFSRMVVSEKVVESSRKAIEEFWREGMASLTL